MFELVDLVARYSKHELPDPISRALEVESKVGRVSTPLPQPELPHIHRAVQRLGADQVEQVVSQYMSGKRVREVALEHHVHPATVRRLAHDAGVPHRQTRMSEEGVARAIELYESGWSLADVGRELGRDTSTIHKLLKRHGVSRRDTHGRDC